jgi:hypothetical protein
VRHKWFVLLAGLKTGAPLWRLIIHDWSKFTPAERGPYVRPFYGPKRADWIAARRAAGPVEGLHTESRLGVVECTAGALAPVEGLATVSRLGVVAVRAIRNPTDEEIALNHLSYLMAA